MISNIFTLLISSIWKADWLLAGVASRRCRRPWHAETHTSTSKYTTGRQKHRPAWQNAHQHVTNTDRGIQNYKNVKSTGWCIKSVQCGMIKYRDVKNTVTQKNNSDVVTICADKKESPNKLMKSNTIFRVRVRHGTPSLQPNTTISFQ